MPGAYSSSMIIIHALLLLALIPLAAGAAPPLSLCGEGNYSSGGAYETNLLDLLLGTLRQIASSSRSLFAKGSLGAAPDTAWALVLCRGDVSADECYGCVTSAGRDAATTCNRSRDVALCYNNCYVRLANYNFLDITDNSGVVASMSALNITSIDVVGYDLALTGLLNATVQYAVQKSSRLFATGQWVGTDPDFNYIYSAAQCASDLSRPQCRNCLQRLMGKWQSTFVRNMWGARQAGPWCTLRSELFPFYLGTDPVVMLPTSAAAPAPAPTAASRGSRTIAMVIGFVVAAVVAALLAEEDIKPTGQIQGTTTPGTSNTTTKKENSQEGDSIVDSDMARKLQNTTSLTVRVLQEITDNFSENRKIGQGVHGQVYVAKLENGEEIAVKVLYNNMPLIDDVQFQREFQNLMRLEHDNIVRLVAYCYETHHQPMRYMGRTIFAERTYRALCFEYMLNGSLEKHLSDECDGLDWHTRYKIIKGTWKGLKHLHEGFDKPIYHLDIKPCNILLDKNMVPKLADFGLSKLFGDKQTMITQTPMGTIGYVPMEFLHGNIVSNKFDIFSLGVVMIKIIAGHEGHSRSVEMPLREFFDLVQEKWRDMMLQTCLASRSLEAYCKQVNVCTEIALSCMNIDRHKRPNIADIINQLNGTEDVFNRALSSSIPTSMP
ncbi:cysteine-rich receptor-like protein kinase 10 [Triticum dicoccoides]|uniref:cysteine-rich receptor-like protein kinase 10 n=1 Tax=Triticum dicoccoides TaxID=85692 RepID=UPI00188F08A7|nr:cysteine-rich receptor-like protein kinase 10 [Triticum dicoccoides]